MTPTISSLLSRVRAASGPDRELDCEIALALCGWKIWKSKYGYWNVDGPDQKSFNVGGRPTNVIYDNSTGRKLPPEVEPRDWADEADLPEWTASIDAAVALAERVLPGCSFTILRDWGGLNRCRIWTDDITPAPPYVGTAASLPLAILAALLSALEQKCLMSGRHRQRLNAFHRQGGLCAFCDDPVSLSASSAKYKPDNAGVLYHLDARLDPDRGKYTSGEIRTVLACQRCEREAQRARQAIVPKEVLHKLSGRYPLEQKESTDV